METITNQEIQAAMRTDFSLFVERSFEELNPSTQYLHNWHIDVIADALEQCQRRKSKRLIINLPPRNLKTHVTSIAFPAFLLGHNPSAQIICASYAQDLANKLASDCRSLMLSDWYRRLFGGTMLAARRQSISDFETTQKGFRLSTSVGGVLTGRGADFIIIDDPLRPDEALSETRRKSVNEWFDHSLLSRLNDKRSGCVILIMQRLHEDDLVGHVLPQGDWKLVKFPAIAEANEHYAIQTLYGERNFTRLTGEALHPEREPLELLTRLRETIGEYNFAGQYQQAPSPLGGGMIKTQWFKTYTSAELSKEFEFIFQSWDTAAKSSELNDYSVCTTWGVREKKLYLLDVFRKRLDYPDLRRTVKEHAATYLAKNILIEDKSSGTQLIQDMVADGVHGTTCYQPKAEKVMRMHSVTPAIKNGLVFIPAEAVWLPEYLHEMATFPNVKYDDQVDSTSQALDWFKQGLGDFGLLDWLKEQAKMLGLSAGGSSARLTQSSPKQAESQNVPGGPCCGSPLPVSISGCTRCNNCGAQFWPDGRPPVAPQIRRDLFLKGRYTRMRF